jgi:drug/metabolite transporter (DMT)-like permease
MAKSFRGTLLLAALAVAWGANYFWIEISLDDSTPTGVTFLRLVAGALGIFLLVSRQRLPVGLAIWSRIFVAALLANAVPCLLFSLGETQVDSGMAGVLNAATPMFATAFAIASSRKVPAAQSVVGLALGVVGSILILSPWQHGQADTWGVLACLGAAVSCALSYPYISRHLAFLDHSAMALSACRLFAAAIWLIPSLLFGGPGNPVDTSTSIVAIVILGTVGTGFAFMLNYALIRGEGPEKASLTAYLPPLVSLALGVAFLEEKLSGLAALGAVSVLLGVAFPRRDRQMSA